MARFRPYLPYIILLGLGIWLLDSSFGRIIHYANDYFFGTEIDSYKNYFTAAYYIKYDEGTHFAGMNYPYGEHIAYTDNQPLISWILKFVQKNIYPVSDYVPAIFNWLMIFSILGCMWWMFLILRRMKLPDWYAIPIAILISMLSPQIHRIVGHYALSYAFLLPMWWYLLLRHEDLSRKWLNILLLGTTITLSGFLHPYHLLMGGMFGFLFLTFSALPKWKISRKQFWLRVGSAVLIFAGPILFFQLFMIMTDPFDGRPDFGYGFFLYKANWRSVFFPVMGPFHIAWNYISHPPFNAINVEGFAYVGIVATSMGAFTLLRAVRYLWKGYLHRVFSPSFPDGLGTSLLAAIVVLCFSMAIPFIWGLESLPEHIGPLKQFRSLGRFAWVFYYVFAGYAAWYLHLIYRRVRQKGIPHFANAILVIALGIWGIEAALHIHAHTATIKPTQRSNAFKYSPLNYGTRINVKDRMDYLSALDSVGMKVEDFQAILPLPAFQIGSDKFVPRFGSNPRESAILARAFRLSYDTGLPLMCGAMARTPISHTKNLIQVVSNKHIPKEILKDLPNDKPILILKQDKTPLTLAQQRVVHRAKLLHKDIGYSLYQMDVDMLKPDTDWTKARYRAIKKIKRLRWNQFLVQPEVEWMYHTSFDSLEQSDFGEEYLYAEKGPLTIYSGTLPANQLFNVSVWLRIDPSINGFPVLYFKEFDENGEEIMKNRKEVATMFGNEIFEDWQEVGVGIQSTNPNHRVELVFEGEKIAVESLLIRPSRKDVFLPLKGKHSLMFNNYYIE